MLYYYIPLSPIFFKGQAMWDDFERDFVTVKKEVCAQKNKASFFSYNLGYLFFVVAAKQFTLQQK